MNEWNEGISKWRANRLENTFRKKYGHSLSASRKPFNSPRERKYNSRHSRFKKHRLHRVSPKIQKEWAEGVSQWVAQRKVARSNHYFLKKFGIIKGNSSEEWKEGMQVWLDQGLLNKSWKWKASKGKFMPSKNRRRTSYISAYSKAILVPAVSLTNESEQSKEAEEVESLEKDIEENFKQEDESSSDLELLEKQTKPRKNSKLFTLGICSLVGAILCLVYGIGYFHGKAVDKTVIVKKHIEDEKISDHDIANSPDEKFEVSQSDEENKVSLSNQGFEKDQILSGLVGWWKLDEEIGIVAKDSSKNENHASFNGFPIWVEGKLNGALKFDGNAFLVTNDKLNLKGNAPRTISAWWNPAVERGMQGIVSTGTGQQNKNFEILVGKKLASVHFSGDHHWVRGGSLEINNWYLVCGLSDSQKVKLFVNGKLINEKKHKLKTNTNKVYIGKADWKVFPKAKGIIDDVRIYDRALSSPEVQALYNLGQ